MEEWIEGGMEGRKDGLMERDGGMERWRDGEMD